jgi:hypothetical protein
MRKKKWRSGLEKKIREQLTRLGKPIKYEQLHIKYEVPARISTYTPDFQLENGIIIEAKGKLDINDRKKMVLVKAQHPKLDIRFVFQKASNKIYKGSPTTYAEWAEKEGFLWANGLIPEEWINEK